MIQVLVQVLIVALFTGLAGIIWLVVHNRFDDNHSPDDNR
jgi:nitrogen fixation-related uncharacterized protein